MSELEKSRYNWPLQWCRESPVLRAGHFTLTSVPCSVRQEDFMMLINRIKLRLQEENTSPSYESRPNSPNLHFNYFLGANKQRSSKLVHLYTFMSVLNNTLSEKLTWAFIKVICLLIRMRWHLISNQHASFLVHPSFSPTRVICHSARHRLTSSTSRQAKVRESGKTKRSGTQARWKVVTQRVVTFFICPIKHTTEFLIIPLHLIGAMRLLHPQPHPGAGAQK